MQGCYINGKRQFQHGLVCFRCSMKCLLMDKMVRRKNYLGITGKFLSDLLGKNRVYVSQDVNKCFSFIFLLLTIHFKIMFLLPQNQQSTYSQGSSSSGQSRPREGQRSNNRSRDDREGFLKHPKRGRVETYLMEVNVSSFSV